MPEAAAPNGPIRVMIVEDQQLIRRAFKTMLSLEADIDIVAEAGDGQEAIRLARLSKPDVVLMDLQMPRMNGVAATRSRNAKGSALPALSGETAQKVSPAGPGSARKLKRCLSQV